MRRIGLAVIFALGFTLGPVSTEAQQPGKVPRIGVLLFGFPPSATDPKPFRQRLRELGYVEPQNVVFESRYARGREDQLAGLATELIQLKVDVIYAAGDQVILAAKQATKTTPIVMVACDAVAAGLIASLARPGGNITGVTCLSSEIAGKRLALLKEATPRLSPLGVVWNPNDPGKTVEWRNTEAAAQGLGMHVRSLEVHEARDFDRLGTIISRERTDAIVVLGDALTITNRSCSSAWPIRLAKALWRALPVREETSLVPL